MTEEQTRVLEFALRTLAYGTRGIHLLPENREKLWKAGNVQDDLGAAINCVRDAILRTGFFAPSPR